MRSAHAYTITAIAIAVLLTGCSSSNDNTSAEPAPTTPTASPTPTIPEQTPTQYGTNAIISNWDEYYDNPVVQAYREWTALGAASVNAQTIPDGYEDLLAPDLYDQIVSGTRDIWADDITVAPEARTTITSVDITGDEATLVACELSPSMCLKDKNGNYLSSSDASGSVERTFSFLLDARADQWRVAAFPERRGSC